MSQYVLLKHIRVQNANALSSPFSFGFPAVTAFLGFAHALQRQLNRKQSHQRLQIKGVGIASHEFAIQDYQEGSNRTLKLTANPLDKNGNRPSFVEEGRCHFTVSLVLELENLTNDRAITKLLKQLPIFILSRLKLAGGDILEVQEVDILQDERASLRHLMPSYVLMERRDLMVKKMQEGQDALDALLHFLKIHHSCKQDNEGNVNWQSNRANSGWLVPIATGFHAISKLALAQNQRDPHTPHRFAESLVTLGEFIMPHRLEKLSDMIWRYQYNSDSYTCLQKILSSGDFK